LKAFSSKRKKKEENAHIINKFINKKGARKMVHSDADDLIVKRKGGGSIIDQRPLFSSDGE